MRITGSRMLELATQATSRAQTEVADTASQLSSGKRVDRASDDPLAWAQSRRAALRRTMSEGRGEAMSSAREHLGETERALASIGGALAESRQIAVQAANAGLGATDRAALGQHVAGLFQTALAAANTRNAAGEYVLAGGVSTAAPFDATGAYAGDSATRELDIDEGARANVSLAGSSLTAAAGVDVLPALGRLATALAANDLTAIQTAIGELDTAHRQVVEARSHVGSMQAVLDEAQQSRASLEDAMTARIAELTDADVITAAGQLAQHTSALAAAQAVNAKLAQLLSPAR